MRKGKKFLALVAAMAMVMAPTTTWAAQSPAESTGEAGNAGAVEGVVDKNYVSYVAPTVANNALDFVLDPQLLIQKTDGETVSGDAVVATEDGTSVYFKNVTDDYDYAASSKALTVTNKGSGDISVSVKATLELDATGAAINVVTGAVASSSTDTALNLNIHLDQITGGSVSASLEKETATKSALSLDVTATGAAASDFEVTKVSGKYEYVPKNANVSGDSVGFVFRGECNTNEDADWSKVKDMKASFDVVWDVKAASGNNTVSASNLEITWDRSQDLTFEVDLGSFSATSITDIGVNSNNTIYDYTGSWGGRSVLKTMNFAVVDGNKITLKTSLGNYLKANETLYMKVNNTSAGTIRITAK